MAKTTYYEIDPISSTAIALNDSSGTPNTEVLWCSIPWEASTDITSLVGCGSTTAIVSTAGRRAISLELEIQSESMDNVYTKIAALDVACAGDKSIPIDLLTQNTFNFAIAIDGSTKYGFQYCRIVRIDPDLRAQYTSGGVSYRLLQQPYFTRVRLEFTSGTSSMVQL